MTSGTPLPEHQGCGGKLVLPKIFYKKNGKTVSEHTDNKWFCIKCRQTVELKVVQK